jgi:hypothetical protein
MFTVVHCYFVVWTECDYSDVVMPKDPSFKNVMDMLEHFVFTFLYPYLFSDARAERVERFRAAQEERRHKKLKIFQENDRKLSSLLYHTSQMLNISALSK